LPQVLEITQVILTSGDITNSVLPEGTTPYFLLFLYGYISLSINMYRLVILGETSVSIKTPIFNIGQIARFAGLTLIIGFATIIPVLLTGISFLQLIIYFLIIPITLNFINIATNQPSKYKWKLNFVTQSNLFLLQVIIPALIGMITTFIFNSIGLPEAFSWSVDIIVFYWSLINLALCYQLINANTLK
jgi:hypothetical protein